MDYTITREERTNGHTEGNADEDRGQGGRGRGFRARLLSDPKGAIGQELGVTMRVAVGGGPRRERCDRAPDSSPDSKLNEGDLQAVAAGGQSRLFGRNVDTAISDW